MLSLGVHHGNQIPLRCGELVPEKAKQLCCLGLSSWLFLQILSFLISVLLSLDGLINLVLLLTLIWSRFDINTGVNHCFAHYRK